jgi:putative ABC transport system permease protein
MNRMYAFLFTCIRLALRQLLRHKVRSFLTMLGILIGVGSVVAIVSLGEGLRGMFMGQIANQATADMLYVMPDAPMQPGGHVPRGIKPFKNRDVSMIKTSDYVAQAYGMHMMDVVVKHGWRSETVQCAIGPKEYFATEKWVIERGRMVTETEERGGAMVCIIGSDIQDKVYEKGEDALGSFLNINGQRFKVIATLEKRSAMMGGGQANSMVFVPVRTGQTRLQGSDDLFWIMVRVKDSTKLETAKEDVSSRLRASRRIRSGADDDFQISSTEDWAKFTNQFVSTLIMVFGVVAVIALVVGGIGVMNIMLVNVKERTREIGLRKALGATSGEITWQFLVESMTLTLVGGLLGTGSGYLLGLIVAVVMKAMWDVFWWPSVPFVWIAAVLGTCIGIGLVFGVYPAYRAGGLDPIVALRYE